jgi:hypothetical protein
MMILKHITAFKISGKSLPCSFSDSITNLSINKETKEEKIKKLNLYTKTRDTGTLFFYNGQRKPKNDLLFELLGHQDELNAVIGIAREHCAITRNGLNEMLIEVQSRVFDLGALVATLVLSSSNWIRLISFCTYVICMYINIYMYIFL